jgi:flagellar motor switch/type III secretory pathway protein FliN
MADLLTIEERTALQEPFTALRNETGDVEPALFPSVSQLDPEQSAALTAALKRWLELLVKDLARQLRVPLAGRPPRQQAIARHLLPIPDHFSVWGQVEGFAEHRLIVSLPRSLGAAICERICGAPFEANGGLPVGEDRKLYRSELVLLRELGRNWLSELTNAWKDYPITPCAGGGGLNASDGDEGDERTELSGNSGSWLQFSHEIVCGTASDLAAPVTGEIHLCMSADTARLLLGQVSPTAVDLTSAESVRDRLGNVPIEMRARLGATEFTFDQLWSLRVGDVITLARKTSDPIDLLVDDRPILKARAGLAGQRVALEVVGEYEEESDEC